MGAARPSTLACHSLSYGIRTRTPLRPPACTEIETPCVPNERTTTPDNPFGAVTRPVEPSITTRCAGSKSGRITSRSASPPEETRSHRPYTVASGGAPATEHNAYAPSVCTPGPAHVADVGD